MKITFLLFFILSFSSSVLARIGETKDECRARYGKELAQLRDQRLMFKKHNFNIHCFFTNNVCDYIIYISGELDPATEHLTYPHVKPRLLTDLEIETLLEANGGGWKKLSLPGVDFSWVTVTAPKPLLAIYSLKTRNFEISTKERLDRERLKEKSKLNGL